VAWPAVKHKRLNSASEIVPSKEHSASFRATNLVRGSPTPAMSRWGRARGGSLVQRSQLPIPEISCDA